MADFSFGAPVSSTNFYNRQDELEYMRKRLFSASRNDMALIGPRRVGKSSLLLRVAEEAKRRKMKAVFMDCEGLSPEFFIKEYGNAFIEAEIGGKVSKKIREALRAGASQAIAMLSELLGKVSALELSSEFANFLKLRIEFEKDSLSGRKKGESLFALLGAVLSLPQKSGEKYLIIFDEFQETAAYAFETPFHAIFRRATQFQKNAVYLYAGSSTGMMKEIFGNPKNPLAGNVDILNVGPFSETISRKFMVSALGGHGKKISDDALELLCRKTNGFPIYLNWIGLRCTDLQKNRISVGEIESINREMLSPASPVYQMVEKQVGRLGYKSRLVLKALASGSRTAKEVASFSGASNPFVYFRRLSEYGIIEKNNGGYRIIDPVLAELVKLY